MNDPECIQFLQWALPRLRMRWPGFRKVRKQVCKRINRRLRELGLADLEAYRDLLEAHQQEWAELDRFCRISISRFYRDRGVFEYLRDEVLPTLALTVRATGDDTVRCWSAGCASGEEAYTLNIMWKLQLGLRFPDLTLSVIATDGDLTMLDRARLGCYSRSSLKNVPPDWLVVAFTKSDEFSCVKPEFRGHVEFVRQDIRREMPPGRFHLILCRHLAFTYFDQALQEETFRRLLSKLFPGGILVTGKQERLPMRSADLEECRSGLGVFRKSENT